MPDCQTWQRSLTIQPVGDHTPIVFEARFSNGKHHRQHQHPEASRDKTTSTTTWLQSVATKGSPNVVWCWQTRKNLYKYIYIYIMLSDPCLYETESGWTAWIATAMVPPTTAAPAVPSPHKICNCQTFISIGNGRWGRGDSGQYCYQSIEVLGVPSCAQEFSFLLSLPTFLCICCKHLLTRSGWRQ